MQDVAPISPDAKKTMRLVVDSAINRQTEHNIHLYSMQSTESINKHIKELKSAWSPDRFVAVGAFVLAIIGIALGAFVSRWCLLLPAVICTYLLLQMVMRFRLVPAFLQGKDRRTDSEIGAEIFAMKLLRYEATTPDKDKAAVAERTIAATRVYSSDD